MRSDDELLSHIRQQAGVRRQRRQRAVVGAAVAAVVLLAGVGALAASGGDDTEGITADGPGTTSTTEEPTTTEAETTTTSTTTSTTTTEAAPPTTTEAPPATTTEPPATTTPPTTTTLPPLPDLVETATRQGLTLTATLQRDPARPGWVRLTARIRTAHGSAPHGDVDWDDDGLSHTFGPFPMDFATPECRPDTNPDLAPDPDAGPVDETFTIEGEITPGADFDQRIPVTAAVSHCTADAAVVSVELLVPKG